MASREEGTGRKELSGQQAGIVIGGLLLVLLVVYFLFLRGGGEEPEAAAPPPAPPAEVVPTPTEPGKPDKEGPVETFEVFASKDPFKPLITAAGLGGDTTGGDGTTGTDTNGDGVIDGDDIGGTDPGGDTNGDGVIDGDDTDSGSGNGDDSSDGSGNGDGTSNGGGGQQVDGRTVRLIDVFTVNGEQRAQIQVDGTVYTVDEGERFAENFELLDISGQCASILYGDDQFTICEGEEILK